MLPDCDNSTGIDGRLIHRRPLGPRSEYPPPSLSSLASRILTQTSIPPTTSSTFLPNTPSSTSFNSPACLSLSPSSWVEERSWCTRSIALECERLFSRLFLSARSYRCVAPSFDGLLLRWTVKEGGISVEKMSEQCPKITSSESDTVTQLCTPTAWSNARKGAEKVGPIVMIFFRRAREKFVVALSLLFTSDLLSRTVTHSPASPTLLLSLNAAM